MRRLALLAAALSLPLSASALKVEKLKGVLAGGGDMEVVAERAFVRFAGGTTAAQKAATLAAIGAGIQMEYPSIGWTYVRLPAGMSVPVGLNLLKAQPGIVEVEPDNAYRPVLVPNDPSAAQQYALSQVNAFSAWEYETGASSTTTVAVLDAGVDSAHPEFAGKMSGLAHEFCDPDTGVCTAEGTPAQACNHGTRVAGVAAAAGNNSSGIAGMNWSARILSERIFRAPDCTSECGGAGCVTNNAGIISAINHVIALQNQAAYGHMVINLSIGGAGACPAAIRTAMNDAVTAGIPVVVAAGNDGGAVNTPANCATATGGTGIIPVGATDALNNVATFSSRGAELAANGLVAPGKDVLTTDLSGAYASASGTSFSAPHVAGMAALILSKKPGFTALQTQSTLRGAADGIGVSGLGVASAQPQGNVSGAGRMNAFRAMRLAVNGTLADFEGDQKAIAFPNPFRLAQTGSVSLTVPTSLQGARTTIKVYTIDGQLVRELNGLTWDGKNANGKLVASGTYVFLVSTDRGTTKGRVAVIR